MGEAKPGGLAAPPHLVMVVVGNLATDSRVRKSAESASATGLRVTVVWVNSRNHRVVHGTLGDVATIGLPLDRTLINRRHRRRRRAREWRPGLIAYRSPDESLAGARALLAARQRGVYRSRLFRLTRAPLVAAHTARAAAQRTLDDWFTALWSGWDRHVDPLVSRIAWHRPIPLAEDLEASLPRVLWRLKPDIIHAHDIYPLEAAVIAKSYLAAHGHHADLVYDAHEFVAGVSGGDVVARRSWARLEAECIPHADAVITVSGPIADAIQRRHGLRTRPEVVLNTPMLERGDGTGPSIRADCGLPDATPLVVYSGGIAPQRGIDELVEAMTTIPEAHLALICVPDTTNHRAMAVRALADSLGLTDRVHFLEPVPSDSVVDYLRSADVGVHPLRSGADNHEMALPNKLFDYIHAGLGIVVSDVALMSAFVAEHGIGQSFASGNAIACASAIRKTLEDLDVYQAATADPVLRREHSWDHQAQTMNEVYASLVRARRS